MANKINNDYTFEKYRKKYRNCKHKLLKFTKKEIEDFDKNNTTNIKGYLLKGRKWCLINDTYYEIPSNKVKVWWSNLGKAGQIAVSCLGAAAVAAAIAVPTTLISINKNSLNGFYNFMKISKADFEDSNKAIGPATQADYNSSATIHKGEEGGGVKVNKALTNGYYNLFEKNENYLKQDIMYALTGTIDDYKSKFATSVGSISNLNGDLIMKISDLHLSKDVIFEKEGKNSHYLICSFNGEYKSNLSADIEFLNGEKYELSTNLSGKLEYSNLFINLEPQSKTSGKNPAIWSNFNFKIWSSTHNTKTGSEVSSSLKSYATGSTIVKEKGKTSKLTYTRVENEPISYKDPHYPSPIDYEAFYNDPICFLVSSIKEDISYSCKNVYLPIYYAQD